MNGINEERSTKQKSRESQVKSRLQTDMDNDTFLEMQSKIVDLENQLTEERNQSLMNENKIAEVEAHKSTGFNANL